MNNWKCMVPWALGAAIVFTLLFVVILARETILEYESKRKIKDLETTNALLVESNIALTTTIENLENEADSILTLIERSHNEITTIKIKKNEKTQAIDDFTNDELWGFFSKFAPFIENH